MTNKRSRISLPMRGYGMSLSNMIDVIFGDATAKQEGNWIDVEEEQPGIFIVVDDNMTVKTGSWITECTTLGFSQWDEEVVDLDGAEEYPSDESSCFGMSNHLRWKDVDLTPYRFKASSFEQLQEAFKHVALCAWCPGDI